MYSKQTWLPQEGTKLNRFSKVNETPESVELLRDPESVTQPGTPFSVPRMQYIEDGIESVDRQNIATTVTGGTFFIGTNFYGTILVNVGTSVLTASSAADLGRKYLIRKISATAGTITINLPATHTFPDGSSSITLTNQYEEVTIERVSSTKWVEKDRVEVFYLTTFLNGWTAVAGEEPRLVLKNDKITGYGRATQTGSYTIPASASVLAEIPVRCRQTAPAKNIGNIVVLSVGGKAYSDSVLLTHNTSGGLTLYGNDQSISAGDYIRLDGLSWDRRTL